jgi:hypothetical protein
MAHLEPKPPRAPDPCPPPPEGARRPENLVAEIVDQITEKQSRAAGLEGSPRSQSIPEPAGTHYLAVLSCATDEPGSP